MIASVLNVFIEISVTTLIVTLLVFVWLVASSAERAELDECDLHAIRRLLEARLTAWQIRHDGRVMRRELDEELRRR